MPTAAERAAQLADRPSGAVRHIAPGSDGLPLLGDLWGFTRDPRGLCRRMMATHGRTFRLEILGAPMLVTGEPDLIREVLLDRAQVYSNRMGWHSAIGQLFAGGLMLRDFDEHRAHRGIMQAAFKPRALEGYLQVLNRIVERTLPGWGQARDFDAYAATKQLTLDIAAEAFLGVELGDEAARLNRAFVDMVAASIAVVRMEVPGLAYHRGMRARRTLQVYFSELVQARRGQPGQDMFSQLCNARDDDGATFTDDEVIDHFIFLMMAAHDTTTSTLTSVFWALAQHPSWQSRAAEPMREAGTPHMRWDDREQFTDFDLCLQEVLRMFPAVPFLGRRTTCETRLGSLTLPANTSVAPSALIAHYLPEFWTDPERFDPERFAPNRAEHRRHSHCYFPFGGGAHTCLGMQFARFQVRAIVYQVLRAYDLRLPEHHRLDMQSVPIPKPRGGLPLQLTRR